MYKGSCLCDAVTFSVSGALRDPDSCHCRICRKWSGHYLVSTDIPREALNIQGAENVTWYHSSEKVRRGFCKICGSNLFFDPVIETDWTAVSMGAFDGKTDVATNIHIFVSQKGDYYEITDDLPQNER